MARSLTFLTKLRRLMPSLVELEPDATKTLHIDADYGHYAVTIGPEYPEHECRARAIRMHSRPIAIEGEVDHLFLEGEEVTPHPGRQSVEQHLQKTVVIRGLQVHIYDPIGTGNLAPSYAQSSSSIVVRHVLNLADESGPDHLARIQSNGYLTSETYRIIQEDILSLLRKTRAQRKGQQIS